jgi:chromosome partitioning protein
MSKTIAICNQKGGVGKTTTTVNLGVGLARAGHRVLLVDADPQGDLTASLGVRNADGLPLTLTDLMTAAINGDDVDPAAYTLKYAEPQSAGGAEVAFIPSNIALAALEMQLFTVMRHEGVLSDALSAFADDYDYILIDCMPSLGTLTVNALAASDSVIIPVQAQFLAAKGMTDLAKTIAMTKRRINPRLAIDGIVMTLYDARTKLASASRAAVEQSAGETVRVFNTNIPMAIKAAESAQAGKSIFVYAPGSPVASAYEALTQEVRSLGGEYQKEQVCHGGQAKAEL